MLRKLSWPAVLGLAVITFWAGTLIAQQVTGTVVLKSGERHTGADIDYHFNAGSRLVSVRTGLHTQPRVDVGQVAYIDFGGAPEVQLNLTGSQEAVVLKDGTVIRGQVLSVAHDNPSDNTTPFHVIIRDTSGQEQRLPIDRVGRVYFAGAPTTSTAPTTGNVTGAEADGIVVSARQQWTPTGITVRRGELLTFNTTGEIRLSADPADMAGPAGARSQRYAPNSPLPRAFAGGLIGRVGNGRPFGIGDQTSVPMPAAGQLFLGINDDGLDDNQGEFRVQIKRSGRVRR